jgi:hypothetical protein
LFAILGLAEFDSRWSKGLRQIQSTLDRLKPNLNVKEANSLESQVEQLEKGAKLMRGKLTKKLAEVKNFDNLRKMHFINLK